MLGVLIGLVLLLLLGVAVSWLVWPGHAEPIRDSDGRVIPGSISTMEKVTLGGDKQWIVIRGRRASNPILLFLAGGPGGSELGFLRKFNSALEHHFTVVSWEQRGAGKSWPLMVLKQKLRPEQLVADGLELTDYLRKRFNQAKIYLVGHSGGTFWGIRMVQEHPE